MLSLPELYVRFLDFRTLGDKPNRWGGADCGARQGQGRGDSDAG